MSAAYGAAVDRRAFIVVVVGGVAGAAVRWLTGEVIDDRILTMLIVNTIGTGILGAVAHGILLGNTTRNLLLGVGFCGGLTTFSTFAVEVAVRLDDGKVLDGLGVTLISVSLGLVAFLAGVMTSRWAT